MIEYDITYETPYKATIHYISAALTAYAIIGEYILVAKGDKSVEKSA